MSMMTDRDSITQTILDYFEGWFDGDSARMERALHRDLVKRGRARFESGSATGEGRLEFTSAERMVQLTREGEGKADAADRRLEIDVNDVYQDIASVTVRSAPYHEYVHLVRTDDGWKIVNALFETK